MSKATIQRLAFVMAVDEQGEHWYTWGNRGHFVKAEYSDDFTPRPTADGLNKVRLKYRKGLEPGCVVTVAKSSYILAQNDDGSQRLDAVKVARKVWRAKVPRAYFETGEKAKKIKVTRGEAARFIEGVNRTLAYLSQHYPSVPNKATSISRSTYHKAAAFGGRDKNYNACVELQPHSTSVATWIQNGFQDYVTVRYLWNGTPFQGTCDPYRIGQAVAMHEAAHVIQFVDHNGGDRSHGRLFQQLLARIIRECGQQVWLIESRKSRL